MSLSVTVHLEPTSEEEDVLLFWEDTIPDMSLREAGNANDDGLHEDDLDATVRYFSWNIDTQKATSHTPKVNKCQDEGVVPTTGFQNAKPFSDEQDEEEEEMNNRVVDTKPFDEQDREEEEANNRIVENDTAGREMPLSDAIDLAERESRGSSEGAADDGQGIEGPARADLLPTPVVVVDLDPASLKIEDHVPGRQVGNEQKDKDEEEDEVVLMFWEDPFPDLSLRGDEVLMFEEDPIPDLSLRQGVTRVEKDLSPRKEVTTIDKARRCFSWDETPKRKMNGREKKKKKKQATTSKVTSIKHKPNTTNLSVGTKDRKIIRPPANSAPLVDTVSLNIDNPASLKVATSLDLNHSASRNIDNPASLASSALLKDLRFRLIITKLASILDVTPDYISSKAIDGWYFGELTASSTTSIVAMFGTLRQNHPHPMSKVDKFLGAEDLKGGRGVERVFDRLGVLVACGWVLDRDGQGRRETNPAFWERGLPLYHAMLAEVLRVSSGL